MWNWKVGKIASHDDDDDDFVIQWEREHCLNADFPKRDT